MVIGFFIVGTSNPRGLEFQSGHDLMVRRRSHS